MIETIREVLARPWAYRLFFRTIGAHGRSRVLVRDHIRPRKHDRVLEIGCGPGTIVPFLPDVEYVGFDSNEAYIIEARRRFPRGRFVCERVSEYTLPERGYFDIALALGILHHLDDAEARRLFQIAHEALKPGGRLVTLDGVWTSDQSGATRYLLARDRGRFVRSEKAYLDLAGPLFANVKSTIHHGMLRIPYTHIILECTR